jgi:hypothetical protein
MNDLCVMIDAFSIAGSFRSGRSVYMDNQATTPGIE